MTANIAVLNGARCPCHPPAWNATGRSVIVYGCVQDLSSYVREVRRDSVALRERVKGYEADQQHLRSGLASSLAEGRCLKSANARLSVMLKSGSRWDDEACETLEGVCLNQALEIQSLKGRLAETGCETASSSEKQLPPTPPPTGGGCFASVAPLQAAGVSARNTVSDGRAKKTEKIEMIESNGKPERAPAQELKLRLGAARVISQHRYNQSSSTKQGLHASTPLASTSWSKVVIQTCTCAL